MSYEFKVQGLIMQTELPAFISQKSKATIPLYLPLSPPKNNSKI